MDDRNTPEFSIYIGRDCIGRTIEQELGKWAAFTVDDESLGLFPNRRAATDAIIIASHGEAPA